MYGPSNATANTTALPQSISSPQPSEPDPASPRHGQIGVRQPGPHGRGTVDVHVELNPFTALPIEVLRAITNRLPQYRDVAHLASTSTSARALFQRHDRLLLAPSRYLTRADRIGKQTDIHALVADLMAAQLSHDETASILLAISRKLPNVARSYRAMAATSLIDALGALPDRALVTPVGSRTLIEYCVSEYLRAFNRDNGGQVQIVIDRLFQVMDSSRSPELQGLTMRGLRGAVGWVDPALQHGLARRMIERVDTLPPEHRHGIRWATD